MDYEQKYKDALNRAKAYHRNELAGTRKEMTEYIFPELAESNDERMINEIIHTVTGYHPTHTTEENNKMVDWLKKQKAHLYILSAQDFEGNNILAKSHSYFNIEQKPVEWSKEQQQYFDEILVCFLADEHEREANLLKTLFEQAKGLSKENVNNAIESFNSQRKQEWSEEDETMINHIIEALPKWANGLITILPSQAEEYVKRLKSLRPQPNQGWRHYIWMHNLRFNDDALIRYEDNGKYELVHAGSNPQRAVCGDYILIKDISPYLHWKLSEEDIEAFKEFIDDANKSGWVTPGASRLYEQLKALM